MRWRWDQARAAGSPSPGRSTRPCARRSGPTRPGRGRATKIDLSSHTADVANTISSALGFISDASKARQAAAERAAKIMAPATLGTSEASSAKAIFANVDAQQDAAVAAGLDPQKIFGSLLNYASNLVQSAKDRLIDAANASA